MGSFAFVREAVRKPYVIANYLYANSLYANTMPGDGGYSVDEVNSAGVLKSAKWTAIHEVTEENQVAAGHEVFRLECQSCHTVDAYRGIRQYLVKNEWDQNTIYQMLGGLNFMHDIEHGAMPPFAGTDAERAALAAYLATIHPVDANAPQPADGATVFARNCAMCHQIKPEDKLFKKLPADPQTASDALKDLTSLFQLMPDLKLNVQQRLALAQWVNQQRAAKGMPAPRQGGN
jgi:mono/diheme cytochrome c family protein